MDKVKRYETPYGCRFEWELLTSQKLVVHLKDKTKIRHRKRWSQVNNVKLFFMILEISVLVTLKFSLVQSEVNFLNDFNSLW